MKLTIIADDIKKDGAGDEHVLMSHHRMEKNEPLYEYVCNLKRDAGNEIYWLNDSVIIVI